MEPDEFLEMAYEDRFIVEEWEFFPDDDPSPYEGTYSEE